MNKELKNIDKQVQNCNLCGELVEKFTHHTTIHQGKNNDLLILGEAPANNGWRKSGKCWYSDTGKITGSGKIMNKLLEPYNLTVEDITFVEAVKCFPKSRSSLKICKSNCETILHKQIKLLNPKLIITLGDYATKSILKENYKKFGDVAGNIYKVNIENNKYEILPIYHPSPISPKSYQGNIDIIKKIKKYI
jgi:uracil-DNA glycosylase family 4